MLARSQLHGRMGPLKAESFVRKRKRRCTSRMCGCTYLQVSRTAGGSPGLNMGHEKSTLKGKMSCDYLEAGM